MTETVVRPTRGSMPKIYFDICNTLIDQGWGFVPRTVSGGKHKLIPPDPTKPQLSVSATPSPSSLIVFVTKLRRCGAILDDETIDRIGRRDSRRRLREAMRAHGLTERQVEADPALQPVSTVGNRWWLPEPEPEPEPAPRVRVRTVAPVGPDDARGTAWTLAQARDMIRQGYHAKKVVQKTGWGLNHLRDLIDSTGYYNFT